MTQISFEVSGGDGPQIIAEKIRKAQLRGLASQIHESEILDFHPRSCFAHRRQALEIYNYADED